LTANIVGCVALVGSACSGDDVTATTPPPVTVAAATTSTSAASTTTTAAPPATTTPATTTTATVDDSGRVGSRDALEAAIASIVEELRLPYPDIVDADVPIPDLTNPDPVVALEELSRFVQWIDANYPANQWTPLTAYPDSPEQDLYELVNETLYFEQRRLIRNGDPWVYHGGEVVDLSTLDLPADTLEGIPATAVGVLYRSSSGPIDVFEVETGNILDTLDGWTQRQSLAVLVPTLTGWTFWDTLLGFDGVSS